nr:ribonuclease H-like domain-containing protein [Tanacetum cinerariifolium]
MNKTYLLHQVPPSLRIRFLTLRRKIYLRVNVANPSAVSAARVNAARLSAGNPQQALKDKGVIDSGCSGHMIGNISYLSNFKELNGGYVAFGGNPKG